MIKSVRQNSWIIKIRMSKNLQGETEWLDHQITMSKNLVFMGQHMHPFWILWGRVDRCTPGKLSVIVFTDLERDLL